MINKEWRCNKNNYDYTRIRGYRDIEYIVIHYTGNNKDTALNNVKYFNRTITKTSAHYFIDKEGNICKSVNINRIAWSVGGLYKKVPLYTKARNDNTISIELCDIVNSGVSAKQKKALKKLIKALYKKCPCIKDIIRHYDVNGKNCPAYYVANPDKWDKLKKEVLNYVRSDN